MLMQETDEHDTRNRFQREIEGPNSTLPLSEIASLLDSVIQDLISAADVGDSIANLLKTMEIPHVIASDRSKQGLINFEEKLLGSLFGLVTAEEAKDMQHALN